MKITDNDLKLLKEKYPDNLDEILKKVEEGYPIQYLIGYVDFYGYKINVDNSVLIPRFETEYLIEKTINYLKKYNFNNNMQIIDLATGSGCIAITLKHKYPLSTIKAIDISSKALNKCQENMKLNDVELNLEQKDILKDKFSGKYDLIISNPPYVNKNQIVDIQTKYEPQNAIFADNEGLEFYEKIAQISKNIANNKSIIALEIGYDQASKITEIFKKLFPDAIIKVEQDYQNFDRYVFIFNNCE